MKYIINYLDSNLRLVSSKEVDGYKYSIAAELMRREYYPISNGGNMYQHLYTREVITIVKGIDHE